MADDLLLDQLRKNQIFAPTNPIARPSSPTYMSPSTEVQGIDNRLMTASQSPYDQSIDELMNFTPEHLYSDLYRKTLEEMPVRKEPGKGRKILGAIAAFSGQPDARENVLYRDYNRQLGDWKTKMDVLTPGMTYERYANVNERTNRYQAAQAAMNERKLALAQQKSDQQYEIAQKKLKLQALRDQGWMLKTGKDGYIYRVSKQPGSRPENTGVLSDELSDYDKIQMRIDAAEALEDKRQENRLEIQAGSQDYGREMANLRNDLATQLQNMRYDLMQQNRLDTYGNPVQAFDKNGKPLDYLISINGRGDVRKIPLEGGAVVRPNPPGASSTTQSETQKAAGITNRANQIKAAHPEWTRYIRTDPKTGRFLGVIKPFFGSDDIQKQVYEAIYQEPFTAQPAEALRDNPTATRKVGDTKTFPNGNVGRWNGKAWELVKTPGATK